MRPSPTAQIVMGYANTIISAFSKEVSALENKPIENIALVPRNWFNPNLLYYWFNIPSLVATLSMITALVVTSISIARERELGTFDQLLVSPLVPREILLGKIIPGIIIGVLEGLFMWVMGSLVFQILYGIFFAVFIELDRFYYRN